MVGARVLVLRDTFKGLAPPTAGISIPWLIENESFGTDAIAKP